jgi:hypothetical protein
MRLEVELEPRSAETTLILADWQAAWGHSSGRGGIELGAGTSLPALLDLRKRCFDRGITVNAFFPDNL